MRMHSKIFLRIDGIASSFFTRQARCGEQGRQRKTPGKIHRIDRHRTTAACRLTACDFARQTNREGNNGRQAVCRDTNNDQVKMCRTDRLVSAHWWGHGSPGAATCLRWTPCGGEPSGRSNSCDPSEIMLRKMPVITAPDTTRHCQVPRPGCRPSRSSVWRIAVTEVYPAQGLCWKYRLGIVP